MGQARTENYLRGRHPLRKRRAGILLAIGAALLPSTRIMAVDALDDPNNPTKIVVINQAIGADRFYGAGYYGGNSFIANVEAGNVWNGHEATSQEPISYVNYAKNPDGSTQINYDIHATAVGFTMTGLGPFKPGVGYYYYQFGIAPGAQLVSAAIATSFDQQNQGSFSISQQSFDYGYKTVMQTGTDRNVQIFPGAYETFANQKVDVVNSSWGFDSPDGSDIYSMTLDALAFANHQTVCVAAGNHSTPTSPQVSGPASGYNTIAVAALQGVLTTPAFSQPASFSNSGPNDYYDPKAKVNATVPAIRAKVDIAAPGTDLFLAAYTGSTGSRTGLVDPYPGSTNLYLVGAAGTSFSSPIVAGGAALLDDAGYVNFVNPLDPTTRQAVDGRVIKAVLQNSADKIPGWTNNTQLINNVLTTTQGLDYSTGAGALNLNRAYDQYLAGTELLPGTQTFMGTANVPGLGGGTVKDIGWDYGNVSLNNPDDYFINRQLHANEVFTTTLDWFVDRTLDAQDNPGDVSFDDLDLEVWKVTNGVLSQMIATSESAYNNVEHLYFSVPDDGFYAIRVKYFDHNYDVPGNSPTNDDFALAWSIVPEPSSISAILIASLATLRRRRRV